MRRSGPNLPPPLSPATQVKSFKNDLQDSNDFVQLPLQSAVHREIARLQLRSVRAPPVP